MIRRQGELLMSAEPFAYSLTHGGRLSRCEVCLKLSQDGKGLLKCGACKKIRYCSKECQAKGWKFHKEECKGLQRCHPRIPDERIRMLVRIIQRWKRRELNNVPDDVDDPGYRTFSDMMSHGEDLREEYPTECSQVLASLKTFILGLIPHPPWVEVIDMYGKIKTNTFTICDNELQPIGAGLYLSPSLLDHSCVPNAVCSFERKRVNIRMLKDVEVENESDFSKVTISYIDQLALTSERNKQLREQYFFSCHCSMCQDKRRDQLLQSSRCPNKDCKGVILQEEGDFGELLPCEACGYSTFDGNYVSQKKEAVRRCQENYVCVKSLYNKEEYKAGLEIAELTCRECERVLHPTYNIYLWRVRDRLFEFLAKDEKWKEMLDCGIKLLQMNETFYPPNHPNTAILLAKCGRLCETLERYPECCVYHEKALKILEITHGREHEFTIDIKKCANMAFMQNMKHMEDCDID